MLQVFRWIIVLLLLLPFGFVGASDFSDSIPDISTLVENPCDEALSQSTEKQIAKFRRGFGWRPWRYRYRFQRGRYLGDLGWGVFGAVYRVELDNRILAVKVLDNRDLLKDRKSQSVPIQMILGKAGVAAPLFGLLKRRDLKRIGIPNVYWNSVGLVMEELHGISVKGPGYDNSADSISMTLAEFEGLLGRAMAVDHLLVRAGICPMDVDAFILPNLEIKLIDLHFYWFGNDCLGSGNRLRSRVESLFRDEYIKITDMD